MNRFQKMSPEEFSKARPKSEAELLPFQREQEFRGYCQEHNLDPADEAAREEYQTVLRESGDSAWNDMDDDDRDGWEHNITKSFD